MKKRQVYRLANKLLTAAVLFSQAVFLLAPANLVLAQSVLSLSWYVSPPTTVTSTVRVSVYSNYADAGVHFWVQGSVSQNFSATIHDSTSNVFAADWNITGLTPGLYQIKAEASRAGEVASTNIVEVNVIPGGYNSDPSSTTNYYDNTAPSIPIALVSTAYDHNFVTLNWQSSTDNVAVDHYQIYRSAAGTWSSIGISSTNSYTDTTVTAGTPYYYKVTAYDAAGNQSSPSTVLFLNVPTTEAPNPPTNLTAVQNGTLININWTNSAGATHYAVQRSINGAAYIALTTNTSVNYYLDSNVTIGSNYAYRVFACDLSCSPYPSISNTVTVLATSNNTTATTTVIAPSNLTASVSGSTVTLNWTDNSSNESGFKIYRSQNGIPTDIGNVGSNVTTKIDSSLLAGSYKYKVQAFVSTGSYPVYSAVSNETSLITVGQADLASATTSTPLTTTASTTPNYWIDFYQPPSLLSTSSRIFARTNFLADRINFTIQNHGSFVGELQPNSLSDSYYYAFRWDLSNFSNNTYQLNVSGSKGVETFNSQYISIQVLKPTTQIDLYKTVATTTASTTINSISTSTIIKQPPSINLYQPVSGSILSGWAKLMASSYGPIRRVELIKTKDGLSTSLGNAVLDPSKNQWEYGWDTTREIDGDYAIQIFAWDDKNYKVTGNKISLKIKNAKPAIATTTPTLAPVIVASSTLKTTVNSEPTMPVAPITAEPTAPITAEPTAPVDENNLPPTLTQNINEILQSVAPSVDARCLAAGINDQLKCDNFVATDKSIEAGQIQAVAVLPAECQNANIKNTVDCELLLRSEYVVFECKQAGLTTKTQCREFMESRFGKPAACSGLTDLACQKIISQIILADFVDQQMIDQANDEVEGISGKYLELIQSETKNETARAIITEDTATLSKIDSKFNQQNIRAIEKILPFAKSEKRLNLLILASTDDAQKSKMLVGANILIDSDADGLTDDIEVRLGTDKMNADSDSDGYSDGVEVRNGHNPLGSGDFKITLKPMEQAIVHKAKLEQPKLSGETRSDILKIQKIDNNQIASSTVKTETTNELKLQGRALPNEVASLYIYSVMPIVVTVATDENGNWTYNLDKSLVDGKHEAYVVINDEAGKVKAKSAPFSFFVKEAKAVSQNDFLGADFAVPDRTTELTGWYIAGSLLMITIALGGYLLYQKRKEKNIVYSK